jgi:hypothetical protein
MQNVQHTQVFLKATITVLSVAKNFQVKMPVEIKKKHEKICPGPKKLNFCQYCAKQFKFNYLVIRHEKGM